jgi:hypothetical protein
MLPVLLPHPVAFADLIVMLDAADPLLFMMKVCTELHCLPARMLTSQQDWLLFIQV